MVINYRIAVTTHAPAALYRVDARLVREQTVWQFITRKYAIGSAKKIICPALVIKKKTKTKKLNICIRFTTGYNFLFFYFPSMKKKKTKLTKFPFNFIIDALANFRCNKSRFDLLRAAEKKVSIRHRHFREHGSRFSSLRAPRNISLAERRERGFTVSRINGEITRGERGGRIYGFARGSPARNDEEKIIDRRRHECGTKEL